MSKRSVKDHEVEEHIRSAMLRLRSQKSVSANQSATVGGGMAASGKASAQAVSEARLLWAVPVEYAKGNEAYLYGTYESGSSSGKAGKDGKFLQFDKDRFRLPSEINDEEEEYAEFKRQNQSRHSGVDQNDDRNEQGGGDDSAKYAEQGGEEGSAEYAEHGGEDGSEYYYYFDDYDDYDYYDDDDEPGIFDSFLNSGLGRLITAAAVILLMVGSFGYYQLFMRVDQTVCLDVNPSVTLFVNRAGRVVRTEAYNADARSILAVTTPKGEKVDQAVGKICTTMKKQGY
ncbi:MAG: hypothetical protein Q4F25_01480, partial [Eubacteriales bacterium]|nr:hypothetical protein [Eubacteriales bacterium]